ncbi:MAG: hypothetical protein M1820_002517 [Bogoriella megaspora]|nr:MAG: hypothetical protein M1820_002517 [Bogoriella megaspora]
MTPDHVSRDASAGPLGGHNMFSDNPAFSNLGGDLQYSDANSHFDPALWAPGHGPDELSLPTNQPSAIGHHGWNSTIHQRPTSVNQTHSGFSQSQSYSQPASSAYPGHDYAFNQNFTYGQSHIDPALNPRHVPNSFNLGAQAYGSTGEHANTISPQALQHQDLPGAPRFSVQRTGTANLGSPFNTNQNLDAPASSTPLKAPQGAVSGAFVVTDHDVLAKVTKSQRLHNFVNVGSVPVEVTSLKSTLPNYVRRQSRNDFKRRAAGDKALLARVAKKPSKLKSLSQKTPYQRSTVSKIDAAGRIKQETAESTSDSESSSEDSDSITSDSDLEISEPPPLPPARPETPIGAVRYDTIKAVWASPNRQADAEDIRNGLKNFWEVVRTIRDRWKSDSAALKQAEDAKKNSELPLLKERVKSQRDMMQASVTAALEFGHRDILAFFGENNSFLFLSYQFLLDRFAEKDYDGTLTQGFLALLARCTTITNVALEKTHLVKVLPKLEKRGNEKTTALAKKITAEADKVTKIKGETAKVKAIKDTSKEPQSEFAPSPKPAVGSVVGLKRQRDSGQDGQPVKKINAGSPPASKTIPALAKRNVSGSGADLKNATSTSAMTKPKGQQVQAKPSSIFSALQSAGKKSAAAKASSTSAQLKDKNAAGNSTTEKKPQASAAAATSKPAWSFAQTMANLNKPKEPEKQEAKPTDNLPPETQEQRAKRLRKEARRKLRVSFKPDASLVEVREFERQDGELPDRDNNVRDFDDKGGEGRMFKQHIDTTDPDDDDDYTPQFDDVVLIDYKEPKEIDFSSVDEQKRKDHIMTRGGGLLQVESPESKVQEQREQNTLMVFYGDRSEIPPCPREPSDPYTGEPAQTVMFGEPGDIARSREAKAVQGTAAPQPSITSQAPVPDVSSLLKALGVQSTQQAQPPPPQMQSKGAEGTSALENIFAKFAASQPQQAPMQAPVQSQPTGLNPQMQALWQNLQNQAPAQQFQQQMPQQSAPSQPNLAQLLAQLNPAGAQAPMQGFAMPAQMGTPQQSAAPFENPDRKRWREEQDANGGGRGGGSNKKGKFGDKFVDARYGTVLCTLRAFAD